MLFFLLPGLVNLAAFYSLVLHMYISLAGWSGIGTDGFPDALYMHYALMTYPFFISFFPFDSLWAALDSLLSNQAAEAMAG